MNRWISILIIIFLFKGDVELHQHQNMTDLESKGEGPSSCDATFTHQDESVSIDNGADSLVSA